jgi:hypothetical protein
MNDNGCLDVPPYCYAGDRESDMGSVHGGQETKSARFLHKPKLDWPRNSLCRENLPQELLMLLKCDHPCI